MTDIITAPIRFVAGLPVVAAETAINLLTDWNKFDCEEQDDYNVSFLASSKNDMSTVIYFYTELRSAARRLLFEFADSKKLSYKTTVANSSDLELLCAAFCQVENYLEEIENTTNNNSVQEYKDSLRGLDDLRNRFDLSEGDMKILQQYFSILSKKPKKYTDVKRDIHLYHQYMDVGFRLGFGGRDFGVQSIEQLVDKDEDCYIYYIDDDFTSTFVKGFVNGFNSEIVYAIVISDKHQSITVVFRGSANANDWITNMQCNSTVCYFPGYTTERGDSSTVTKQSFGRVHEGFYKYLFGKTDEGLNGNTKSKGEEIMGRLTSLVSGEKKGYKIIFTGHSLGGALSTLMAVRATALDDFADTTILNVSIASPFVGDQEFRDEFYKLEQLNKIRHLRITNYEDAVPLIPACTFPGSNFHTYKHTGMHIKLYNRSLLRPYHHHIMYPKKDSFVHSVRNALHSNLFNGLNINIMNHLPTEYSTRIENAKEELEKLSLSKLYHDSSLTGWKAEEGKCS